MFETIAGLMKEKKSKWEIEAENDIGKQIN